MPIKKLKDQLISGITDAVEAQTIIEETIDAMLERQELIIRALTIISEKDPPIRSVEFYVLIEKLKN